MNNFCKSFRTLNENFRTSVRKFLIGLVQLTSTCQEKLFGEKNNCITKNLRDDFRASSEKFSEEESKFLDIIVKTVFHKFTETSIKTFGEKPYFFIIFRTLCEKFWPRISKMHSAFSEGLFNKLFLWKKNRFVFFFLLWTKTFWKFGENFSALLSKVHFPSPVKNDIRNFRNNLIFFEWFSCFRQKVFCRVVKTALHAFRGSSNEKLYCEKRTNSVNLFGLWTRTFGLLSESFWLGWCNCLPRVKRKFWGKNHFITKILRDDFRASSEKFSEE